MRWLKAVLWGSDEGDAYSPGLVVYDLVGNSAGIVHYMRALKEREQGVKRGL